MKYKVKVGIFYLVCKCAVNVFFKGYWGIVVRYPLSIVSCYKHSVAMRLKRFLKSSMFPCKIRFGFDADRIWACTPRCTSHLGEYTAKTEPTGPGSEKVVFPKIDTYGAVGKPHLPDLGKSYHQCNLTLSPKCSKIPTYYTTLK